MSGSDCQPLAPLKAALEVKSSPIHGRGLFARHCIAAGTLIGVCDSKPSVVQNAYTLWLEEQDRFVDIVCVLRYINHSPHPNVIYYDDLSVVALLDISSGEELLHDYGEDWL